MNKNNLSLKCFSPPVMILTFFIEIFCAFWVLIKYRKSIYSKIIIGLLLCLAIFQFAEYMVCEGVIIFNSETWARIGYVAITFLPPLGFHLGARIFDPKVKNKYLNWLVIGSYLVALLFGGLFLSLNTNFHDQTCLGNYVIFSISPNLVYSFAAYYYIALALGIVMAWAGSKKVKDKNRQSALLWLAGSYFAFLTPTTLVNIINPETIRGIPSIMCGFAILLALILIWQVAPRVLKLKTNAQTKKNNSDKNHADKKVSKRNNGIEVKKVSDKK